MSEAGAKSWQPWHMSQLDRRGGLAERDALASPARRRADQLSLEAMEQARADAIQQGFDSGYADGLARGLAEAESRMHAELEARYQQDIAATLAPVAELTRSFRSAIDGLDDQIAYQLVELAIETGRQLAGRALQLKPEHIVDDIEELLENHAGLTGSPTLFINMADLELVEPQLGTTLASAGWQLRGDINLLRGDCRIETESGEIDASAADRWSRLLQAVGHGEH